MATYDRLSVGAGGGILSDTKKSDRQDDATICIGLGGTGKDALKKLKKEVYKRLKPDDLDSAVPTYRNIKFLLIDSDNSDLDTTNDISNIDKATEYFDISNNDIVTTFHSKNIIATRQELAWLNHENIPIRTASYGAGGIRQVGRFLLIDKAGLLKPKLTTIIGEALKGVTGDLNIHIFSGISGGTGSGTFIDVCYIVRHVLETLGKESAQVSGYFFLPDVNLSVPSVMSDPLISQYVRCNGYAALKELDYLMGLEEAQDRFVQNYGSFAVDTNRAPVDLCYLISTTNSEGVSMPNGYDYGLSVAVDYVISFLSKITLPDGLAPEKASGMTLKGHIANLAHAKENIQKNHGASFDYNIIGAANAEVPLSDITTYLGAKLFERFGDLSDRTPTEKDLMNFVATNQLSFEQLMQQLTKGITYKVPYPTNITKSNDIIPGDKRAISCADTWTANALGTLEENRKSMLEALNNYDIPENSTSIISRIFSSLYLNYSMDPATGPFFAMRLLGGQNNKNLLHIIDGYIENNTERLKAEQRQDPLRKQDLTAAEQNLSRATFINKGNRINGYLEALNNWYVHLAIIDRHTIMQTLLSGLRDQVVKLNNEFFLVMTIVMDTLKNTFKENNRLLAEGDNPKSAYTLQILTIKDKDIKEQLDKSVKSLDAGQEMKNLVQILFTQWKEWISQDENKITRLVSDYVAQVFLTITNKEMTEYLSTKYQAVGPALVEKIKTDIIQGYLSANANPLFWKNGLFDLSAIAKNSTISVPFNATEITKAAEQTAQSGDTVRYTGLTDRIFMMRFYSGIPLYAYQGLSELEKAYESSTNQAGRHLYEKGDMDWREYLPSPYPHSFQMAGHSIPRIVERNAKLAEELKAARDAGIVYSDQIGDWHVKMTKTADVAQLLAEAGSYEVKGEVDQLRLAEVVDTLRQAREQMFSPDNVELMTISTKGASPNSKETVLQDNYFRYPKIEKVVREQLVKARALDQEIKKLEAELQSTDIENVKKGIFFNAVFTGVIELGRTRTTFTYEEYGMDETLDLQNSSMPYGTKAPLYQAFLTYQELDEDMVERIKEKEMDAIDNMTDEIYGVSKQIREKYTSEFVKFTMSKLATDLRRKEIDAFYKEFMKKLQEHIMAYR